MSNVSIGPTGVVHLEARKFESDDSMRISADIRKGAAYVWMMNMRTRTGKLSATMSHADLRQWCADIIEQIDAVADVAAEQMPEVGR